jgi:hypothetical protein
VLVVSYYDFRNDTGGGELADYWAVFCDPAKTDCRKATGWGGELRLTGRPFDMLGAPIAEGGYFVGDYMGLTRAGDQVIPAFGIVDGVGRTSVYARRIAFGGPPVASSRDW